MTSKLFSLTWQSEYKFIFGLLLLTLDFTVQQQPPFPLSQEQSFQPSSPRGCEEPGFTACSSSAAGTTRYSQLLLLLLLAPTPQWTAATDAAAAPSVLHGPAPTSSDLSALSSPLGLFMSLALDLRS